MVGWTYVRMYVHTLGWLDTEAANVTWAKKVEKRHVIAACERSDVLGDRFGQRSRKPGHELNFPRAAIQSSNCPCPQCCVVMTTWIRNSTVVALHLLSVSSSPSDTKASITVDLLKQVNKSSQSNYSWIFLFYPIFYCLTEFWHSLKSVQWCCQSWAEYNE